MLIVLPKQREGLPAVERSLTAAQWKAWCDRMSSRPEVQVSLPKFRMTSFVSLKETLMSLGMRDAFDPAQADFSGMDGRKRWLYINAVLHKAFVDVNEKGTEAAAATEVGIAPTAVPAPPSTVFRADHPFLFGIRDTGSGSVLFLGRIENPAL
jgi:serpin B